MIVRAQVVIPRTTAVDADASTNTFHFSTIASHATVAPLLRDALIDFYKVGNVPASANAIVAYLAADTATAAAKIKLYDLDESKPRVPFGDYTVNLGIPGGSNMPSEVAVTASYQATPLSGLPRNRQRGRIYLGPLSRSAQESDASARPAGAFTTAINFAMKRLRDAGLAAADWNWVVYSEGARDNSDKTIPYAQRPLLPPTWGEVVSGWTDNSFDTQRRRGVKSTNRNAWS